MTRQLTRRQIRLLVEATRRILHFHREDNLATNWVGLGYMTEYKPVLDSGLMKPVYIPEPRCMTWFKLTTKGASIVQRWIDSGITYQQIEAGDLDPFFGLEEVT